MPRLKSPTSRAEWLAMRRQVITSTESPALFGLSPFATPFELWRRKTTGDDEIDDNPRMRAGRVLEPAIASMAAEDLGVQARALNMFAVHSDVPCLGSSFDYELVGGKAGPGLLEIKNVDWLVFRDEWTDDEAPPHVEIQFQHQLEVMNRSWGVIAVLVGGNDLRLYYRERDREMGAAIIDAAVEFWPRVAGHNPPDIEDYAKDAPSIARLFRDAGGEAIDARGDPDLGPTLDALCAEYTDAAAGEKAAKARKDAAKGRILMAIETAPKVFLDGYTISATTTKAAEVAYTREPFRNFRINVKKDRKQ